MKVFVEQRLEYTPDLLFKAFFDGHKPPLGPPQLWLDDSFYLSIEDSENYTIPYHMFSKGKWRFDPKRAESAVLAGLKAVVDI